MTSVNNRQENIVGRRENAHYQHFLLSPQCLQKSTSGLFDSLPHNHDF